MPKRTRDHHAWLLEQLLDPIVAADYLNEARGDSKKTFLKALRNVAEAKRIATIAEETGLSRESLYKSLSENGNPCLDTYDSVLAALGLDYEFKPAQTSVSISPHQPTGGREIQGCTLSVEFIEPDAGTENGYLTGVNTCFFAQIPIPSSHNSELAKAA